MQLPKWLMSKGIYETNSVTNGVHRVNNLRNLSIVFLKEEKKDL